MPGRPSPRKLSLAILLLAMVLVGVSGTSARASPNDGAVIVDSVEAEDEMAGEEPSAQEDENEEESEAAESGSSGEGSHRPRKHTRRSSGCVVPSVKGSTLTVARRTLLAAHCSLGKIYGPHSSRGALVVRWQSASSGSHLRRGSSVSLRLALRSRQR